MKRANAIVMALGFFMLFAAAVAALMLSSRAQQNIDEVVNTLEVRAEFRQTLVLLQDAEIGQRGFLLTRDPQYLEPYNASRLQVAQRLAALQRIVEPGSEQAARAEQLRNVAMRRLEETDATIALGREGEFGAAIAIVNDNRGKALMDEVRDIVYSALAAESARYGERRTRAIAMRTWLSASLIGALAATLVLTVLSVQLTRRQFAGMANRQEQLRALNDELEARVRDRTRELEIAREMAEAEANRAEYERGRVELLLREVTHRVGNNLAMVSSLLRMQQAKLEDDAARAAIETARGRIQTISTAQRRLRLGDDLQSTRADGLLEAVINDLADTALEGTPISIKGEFEPMVVSSRDATTLAVVLGELISNAIKHAFVGRDRGLIKASFTRRPDGIPFMAVEDDGVGIDESSDVQPKRIGLGSMIIENLSRQYGGEIVKRTNKEGGTSIQILLPKLQIVEVRGISLEERGLE
ncbi:MAG: CHASE3 domain-containing protein [Parvibaculum sp.]|nr:CHASE3 domain-containing protein [Parvibaculum sp.]